MQFSDNKDIPFLKKLWKDTFGDSDQFINLFFDKIYPQCRVITVKSDNQLAGMTYLIPAELQGKTFYYGYAVAVSPAFRGKGLCKNMHKEIKELCKKENAVYGLFPANEKLTEFYQSIGLRPMYGLFENIYHKTNTSSPIQTENCSAKEYMQIRNQYYKNNTVRWPQAYWEIQRQTILENGGIWKKMTYNGTPHIFCGYKKKGTLVLSENTFLQKQEFQNLYNNLCETFHVSQIKYFTVRETENSVGYKTNIYGYAKQQEIYCNMFLND